MKIKDFQIQETKSKNYSTILQNFSWRNNAIKSILNINNKEQEGLNSTTIISKLLNQNIYILN